MQAMYEEKNCQYWRTKIRDSKGNSRQLWQTLSSIMDKENNQSNLGTHCADDFADDFAHSLLTKSTLSANLHPRRRSRTSQPLLHTAWMRAWASVTASEVEKMIGDAPNNTCNLDPAPTWLIKEFHRLLSPLIRCLTHQRFIHQSLGVLRSTSMQSSLHC